MPPKKIKIDQDDGVYIAKSTIKNAGLGLFALHDLPKNHIIAPYEGIILTRDQFLKKYPNGKAHYVFRINNNKYIDAANFESFPRYANSKPRSYANAQLTAQGNLKTRKKIKKDEEIFVSYGNEFHI